MNVLLVSPYRGAIFESAGVRMQPLGISYVGAALKQAGNDVQIELLEDPETLPDFTDADIVGISCTTVQFKPGLKVAKAAKESGKTVIMGGPHPTSSADETLQSGFVDYVVRAEGEVTATELLEGLKLNGDFDPSKINGLSYIDKDSGNIVHTPQRTFVSNLDLLPFPIRHANWRHNGRIELDEEIDYPLITTRGCPYGCKFCDVNVLAGKKFRTRTIENVLKEIDEIVQNYGPRKILLIDDIVNFNSERLNELCDKLIERDLPIIRWVMGRADHLMEHPESAEKMSKAGVRTMFLGIESPDKRILKLYKKGGKASSEITESAVDLLRNNGIETWGAFIIGEPSETKEDIQATIDYAKYLNPGIGQFSVLTPYPGTETWNELQPRLITKDWDKYDAMHAVFKSDHLEPEEVEKLCFKAYRSFYTQPKRIVRELFKGEHFGRPNLKRIKQILKALKVVFK